MNCKGGDMSQSENLFDTALSQADDAI
ncbi:phage tail protein, partial [Salmonella enterica subsp. enterica serovar Weltevreden]|nr:phage tail protein [Salmonella enterica subsp. enterica serovar Weltevreden]